MANEKNKGQAPSTDRLNEIIHVGSTGGYILIAILTIILVAFTTWCVTGKIPATDTYGAVVAQNRPEGEHLCVAFVSTDDYSHSFTEGTQARISMQYGKSFDGTVKAMTEQPYSVEELREKMSVADNEDGILSDWAAANLLTDSDYWYMVEIETAEDVSDYYLQPVRATVLLGEVTPISFLLNN